MRRRVEPWAADQVDSLRPAVRRSAATDTLSRRVTTVGRVGPHLEIHVANPDTGQIKDLVIRGGENIYPQEIEEFLYSHPDVIDAQVVWVPDEKYGEELIAWIRVRDGADAPPAESLRAFCAGRIAHHKMSRSSTTPQ
jgi:acyl-CoA synthetase (AMP-forming)/AMP-acid ligase II